MYEEKDTAKMLFAYQSGKFASVKCKPPYRNRSGASESIKQKAPKKAIRRPIHPENNVFAKYIVGKVTAEARAIQSRMNSQSQRECSETYGKIKIAKNALPKHLQNPESQMAFLVARGVSQTSKGGAETTSEVTST